MATTFINPTDTHSAEVRAQRSEQQDPPVFEIEFSGGYARQFCSARDVRNAILRGEVPSHAHIRKLGAPVGEQPVTVENWAKANPAVKSLYAPVWSLTTKGALVGVLAVAVLKALDTLIGLFLVNPGAAVVWLLLVAGLVWSARSGNYRFWSERPTSVFKLG